MAENDRPSRAPRFEVETVTRESDRGHQLAAEARLAREFARIGTLDSVPWVMISDAAERALSLDARATLLLSEIDGRRTVGMLIDASEMPSADVLATVVDLVGRGILALR